METKSDWTLYMDYMYMIVGSFLCAVSVTSIFDVQGIVVGGLSGLAIIIKELTRNRLQHLPGGIPLWVTIGVVNIPLFVCAAKTKGRRFLIRTVIATVLFTFFLGILEPFTFLPQDHFFSAVAGGAVTGLGMGMLFMTGATTGGTDLLASVLQPRIRRYSVPKILAVINAVIVVAGAFVFGLTNAVYAVAAIYIESKLSDQMLTGMGNSKMVYIISDESEKIADIIIRRLHRGVTGINMKGMYTGKHKCMLLCVVADKELLILKDIVASVDLHAFVIVANAVEALGEGSIYQLNPVDEGVWE